MRWPAAPSCWPGSAIARRRFVRSSRWSAAIRDKRIRQCRLDEAVAALRSNTALQPMSPFGWYQLARVEMDRQLPDEAHRILHHLRSFEPKVAAQLARELQSSVAGAG